MSRVPTRPDPGQTGLWLRTSRGEAKLTLRDVALRAKVSAQHVNNIERGKQPLFDDLAIRLPEPLRSEAIRRAIRRHQEALSQLRKELRRTPNGVDVEAPEMQGT